ncbi:hypothetical protein [Chelativorans salis]|uniref:Uncharacterized protein n=1 Tax=Chelativorans salis TaxID=2978478 RepID=A0ABT2LPH0_9HYPH|nr:hypothetical protein [Chelativorans sp. EGI FJ00035]MCT7375732.1 hypothetical protein [Chelativorans sp. EGI FJ00035]
MTLESEAGQIIVAEERGQDTFTAVHALEAAAVRTGMDSEEAFKTVKRALKRARARHRAAEHGLRNLVAKASGVDAAMDKLLAHMADFDDAARSVAAELADHMDVSPLHKSLWAPVISDRLSAEGRSRRLSAWVPRYEQIRDARKAVPTVEEMIP